MSAKEFFNTLVRFRYSTLRRKLAPIGGGLPSVSSTVLFLGKLRSRGEVQEEVRILIVIVLIIVLIVVAYLLLSRRRR